MEVRIPLGPLNLRRAVFPVMLVIWTLVMTAPVQAVGGPVEDLDGPADGVQVPLELDRSGHFTENLGQWDGQVGFAAQMSFGHALFTPDGVIYDVALEKGGHRVKMTFDDASPVTPVGVGDMGFPTNYLVGNDRASWVTGARSFEELVYTDAWPGIDVRYRFTGGALKYDLVLEGGSDPSLIRFKVEGSEGIGISDRGLDIRLSGSSSILDSQLKAWYGDGGPVDVQFEVDGDTYGFSVAGGSGRSMVIDPVVMHSSTFLGGTYGERAVDVVVDRDDNIVIVGSTSSSDYPTTLGAYQEEIADNFDVALTKMNHNASRIIWSTFIGGTNMDWVNAMAVDERNRLYLAGNTWSGDWPITPGAYCEEMNLGMGAYNIDIYVTMIGPKGDTVEASTFIGGTAAELPYDVDVRDGRVAVGAYTISPDFPTTRGFHAANMGAAAVITLDGNLSKMEGCYIWDGIASESVRAVAIDKNGDVALAGITGSPGFPTTPGAYKAVEGWPSCSFIARYSPATDNLLFCTLLGDGYWDFVSTLAVDDDLNIYVAGSSQLWGNGGHPVTEGAYDQVHDGWYEGFVTKMDPDGTRLIHSTLLGGDGREYVNDIAIDSEGQIVVVGSVDIEQNFSLTSDAHDRTIVGDSEGFIVVLNDDLSDAVYSSFNGGAYEDELNAVCVDAVDNYVVVGQTSSFDYPVTIDGYQTRFAGVDDMTVSVIGEEAPTTAPLSLVATGKEGYIDLTWLPPMDTNGYRLREYHIHRGLSEDDLRPYAVIGDETTFTDEEVEWGVTYHYAVYASNWKGMSPRSNVASAVAVIAPDPPYDLTAEVGIGRVSLGWQAPNFTGGLPILEFRVYRTAEGGEGEPIASLDPGVTTFEDLQADDGTLYTYTVTAVNDHGESLRDASVTVLTMAVPTPPRDPTHEYGKMFIHLSWKPPLEDFGLQVTEYRVFRQTEDGPSEIIGVMGASDLSFNDTHVMVGEPYQYHVTAVNARGESLPSETIDAMVMVPPGEPTDVEAVAHERFVRISWTRPDFDGASQLLGYQVYLVSEGGEAVSIGGKNVAGIADVQLVFLHDVQYDGRVRGYVITAFNAEGEGEPSHIAYTTVFTVPEAPRGLAVEWGDGTLSLGWMGPESNGGTDLTSFTIYRQATGESEPTKLVMVPLDTFAHIDDTVENGVEYIYTVTCTNLVGEGSHSTPVSGIPAGLSEAPISLAAEGRDGSVLVTWMPPDWDGGRPVTGYLLFTVVDGVNVKQIAQTGSDETEFIHDGLVNGEVYVYAVKAVTIVGESGISGLVEARPVGPPSEPLDIQAFWTGDHVVLTWDIPNTDGGTSILGYMVQRADRDGGNWTRVTDPTYTDPTAEPGTTYNYTIYGYNAAGDGPVAQLTFTVPRAEEPPVEPEAFEWTYLVLVVVVLALAVSFLYVTLRKGEDVDVDGRS
jgi:fibronectin type 3 domain-containing protein